jgi:hypothetical protein
MMEATNNVNRFLTLIGLVSSFFFLQSDAFTISSTSKSTFASTSSSSTHPSNIGIIRNYDHYATSALYSSKTEQQEEKQTLLLDEINQMRVKEIKQQLNNANISTDDCFEKSELVQRLYDYKINNSESDSDNKSSAQATKTNNNSSSTSGTSSTTKSRGTNDASTIRVPMDFHSLTTQSVPSNNNIFLRPSPGKFPSISVKLPTKTGKRELNLLVDTACSGLILRPNVAKVLNLPSINTGVTMTAAGGTMNGNNNVCSLDCIQLKDENETLLRDFIVVAQDIGSLPPVLDGIIGLSFLERYNTVSFDFSCGELVLKSEVNAKAKTMSEYDNPMVYETMAETNLSRSRLGIYIASTTLDGRGPVKMILDTGAASTFLNWKGVSDLNMDRSHPLISHNREAIGVMGADNNALALSHRFVLKRRLNFDSTGSSGTVGMFAPGLDIADNDIGTAATSTTDGVNIDIGDLPVLETMRTEDVGGILGSDILMRCDVVHIDNLKDLSSLKLSLLKCKSEDDNYY